MHPDVQPRGRLAQDVSAFEAPECLGRVAPFAGTTRCVDLGQDGRANAMAITGHDDSSVTHWIISFTGDRCRRRDAGCVDGILSASIDARLNKRADLKRWAPT
jgi:hypothetical protein